MTDKEVLKLWFIMALMVGLIVGAEIGAIITEARINNEIRTDQVELKEQVAEIVEDEQVIQDLTTELLSQIEQLKLERQKLRELKLTLSTGEGK